MARLEVDVNKRSYRDDMGGDGHTVVLVQGCGLDSLC